MMFPPVEKLRVLYDADTIRARVRELAGQIDALYGNEPLVVVCVLKGAFLFFSDLVRELSISPELDFVRLASYGNGTESSCSVAFTKDIELSIEGKHVLIVEDIIDSGRSMHFLGSGSSRRAAPEACASPFSSTSANAGNSPFAPTLSDLR